MHFLAHVMLELRTLIHVENSKNGTRLVNAGQRKGLSGIDPGMHRREREMKKKKKKNCKKSGYGCLDLGVKCDRMDLAASDFMTG
jgi:hypothetical protein